MQYPETGTFQCTVYLQGGPKTGPQTHDHNCAKSEPIYKIFTLEDFSVNLQLNEC